MNHHFIRYAQLALAICALFGVHSLGSERQPNIVLLMGGDNGTSTDEALGAPHRGVKGQMYEGGILVPGLIEWPARIPQPRVSTVRANTSDLLPTICGLTGQPLPNRPLNGVDLSDALDGKQNERPSPLYFWQYNTARLGDAKPQPYLDPEMQKGTTPLVKLMGGKATRNFTNFRHPAVTEDDYLGPRAIIDGRFKLSRSGAKEGRGCTRTLRPGC